MRKYSEQSDVYTYVNTSVLKNKLGLTNQQDLDQAGADIVAHRSQELAKSSIQGNFDLSHLRAIHRKLFGDIYEWAGEIRTVDMSKGETRFAHYLWIEPEAQKLLNQLKCERYLQCLEPQQFSERIGFYLGELNVLHPFRDGNGRALREFVRQLAEQAGYKILWKGISQKDMVQASILAYEGDHSMLAGLTFESISY